MSTTTMLPAARAVATATRSGASWKGIYRAGGICLFGTGLIYLTNVTFGAILGVAPADSQQYLQSLADHATLARVTYGLFSLANFLLLPAVLGLYLALRRVARNPMLLATGLMTLFVVLDLALTEFTSLTLVTLTQHAAAATSDAGRAAYAAAADYALATIPLATFYSYVVSSLGLLVIGVVMLRGGFGRLPAYLGMAAGVAGIVAGFYVVLPGLSILLNPTLLVFGLWGLTAGVRLYRLSARVEEPAAD